MHDLPVDPSSRTAVPLGALALRAREVTPLA